MPPSFCGIRTFLQLPHSQGLTGVDAAIVGLPFDAGTSYRSGQRFGPEAIRAISVNLGRWSTAHKVDVFANLRVIDAGDVAIVPGDVRLTYQRIEEHLEPLHEKGVLVIGLGGDHSVTLAELRAAVKKHGRLGLILFDSHPDLWDSYCEQRYSHASPFRRAVEEGLIEAKRSTILGLRGAPDAAEDWDIADRLGFEVRTAERMHSEGLKDLPALIRSRAAEGPMFLSFDIDFLDPAFAPGTGTPAVGGFSTAQMLFLLRELTGVRIVAADVVEVLPAYDVAQITALAAAQVVFEILALQAKQRSLVSCSE
jgi:agmatinase